MFTGLSHEPECHLLIWQHTIGDPSCAEEAFRDGLVAALLGGQDLELVGRARFEELRRHLHARLVRGKIDIELRRNFSTGFINDNVVTDDIDGAKTRQDRRRDRLPSNQKRRLGEGMTANALAE